MNWMDVVVIVILIVYSIRGWMKGFILSFINVVSLIAAIIAAKMYYPMVSEYIAGHSTIFLRIQEFIQLKLHRAVGKAAVAEEVMGERNIFQMLKLPKVIEKLLIKNEMMKDYSERAMDGIYHYISDTLTRVFIDFISILMIFLLVRLLFVVAGHLLDGIASLPVLHTFNSLGGAAFGLFKGVFIIFIFLTILTPFTAMTHEGIFIEGLEKSTVARYLYNHNPIIGLIRVSS